MMSQGVSKKGWTIQEDQIIRQMIQECSEGKVRWVCVSNAIFSKIGKHRTGKQCRQRWQHQLNPDIVRNQWTQSETAKIFQKQAEFGNKWAQIAAFLPGRTDNAVKNYFYSSIRRVFTSLNAYLIQNRTRKDFKNIRLFYSDFLSKLMGVVDGNFDKRVRLTSPEAQLIAKNVLSTISKLIFNQSSGNKEDETQDLEFLILNMQQFRRKCIKRKKIDNLQEEDQRQSELATHMQQRLIRRHSLVNTCSEQQGDKDHYSCSFSNLPFNVLLQTKELQSIKTQQTTFKVFSETQQCQDGQKSQRGVENNQSVNISTVKLNNLKNIQQQSQLPPWGIMEGQFFFKEDSQNPQESFVWRQEEEINIFELHEYRFSEYYIDKRYNILQKISSSKMLEASLALDECLMKATNPQNLHVKSFCHFV